MENVLVRAIRKGCGDVDGKFKYTVDSSEIDDDSDNNHSDSDINDGHLPSHTVINDDSPLNSTTI